MATVYKIHPAIGIARVGNSPEFFIGPERVGEYPNPSGGFKDAQCRIKRQVARFRVFAHHDDGTIEEITPEIADIAWTVHLVNSKASNPSHENAGSEQDLTIDHGPRTLNGPNQQKQFDRPRWMPSWFYRGGRITFSGKTAIVPLGEIQSDNENRLLVFGGIGNSASPSNTDLTNDKSNPGWFDDVSDGPVTATIRIRESNATPAVASAWVIVAPPKFSPQMDNVVTLYDRLLPIMQERFGLAKPMMTSYTRDVYPILQRARNVNWVRDEIPGSAHSWADPVPAGSMREHIFSKLRSPFQSNVGDMPPMPAKVDTNPPDNELTEVQYGHMRRWKDNNPIQYHDDWAGIPEVQTAITPGGLDRAALEACVGAAFDPGVEVGGAEEAMRSILHASNYSEAFRLNAERVKPGAITKYLSLPWQTDFLQCGHNWWPVPRPVFVVPERAWGGAAPLSTEGEVGPRKRPEWARGIQDDKKRNPWLAMVEDWHKLGFVVRQNNLNNFDDSVSTAFVEVERNYSDVSKNINDTAWIYLLTPHVDFGRLPIGKKSRRAITFKVLSPGGHIKFEYEKQPADSALIINNAFVTVGPTARDKSVEATLWLTFLPTSVTDNIEQTVVVRELSMGKRWPIRISGKAAPLRLPKSTEIQKTPPAPEDA